MSLFFRNMSLIEIVIHVFPTDEEISYTFDINKSFSDLKNELHDKNILRKEAYIIVMNDKIMDDNMILKENVVKNNTRINFVRNDCFTIKIEIKDSEDNIQTIKVYTLISNFKVIQLDENKIIKVCYNNHIYLNININFIIIP